MVEGGPLTALRARLAWPGGTAAPRDSSVELVWASITELVVDVLLS